MRSVALTAAALTGLLTLTGCSLQPGVAAQVDEVRISNATVDEITADVCRVDEEAYAQQPIALTTLKGLVVRSLVEAEIARKVGAEYGVGPGSEFGDQMRQIAQQLGDQPDDVRDNYLEVVRAANYAGAVLQAAATEELEAAGEEPTQETLQATVLELLGEAAADSDIEIDPRYGFEYEEGQVAPSEGTGSVAVSAMALAGAADQPDPEYAASLPADQRCGG